MSPLTEQVVVQISYPQSVRLAVQEALAIEHPYRMGTDPQWYVRLTRDRGNLLVARLNQIDGVKASLFGE